MAEHPTFDSYEGYWQTEIAGEQRLVTIDGSESREGETPTFHCVLVLPIVRHDIQAGYVQYGYDGVSQERITRPSDDTLLEAEIEAEKRVNHAERKAEEAQTEVYYARRIHTQVSALISNIHA